MTEKMLREYARRYDRDYPKQDRTVEVEMKRLLRRQRYLNRDNLIRIGRWKSRRPTRHYESPRNDETTVQDVTKFSFSTRSERARIESLLVLKGVHWRVASAILHFAFPTRYPIMDIRVVKSLVHFGVMEEGAGRLIDTFDFWERYCATIREIAAGYEASIRMVEKALWKYDKDNL